MTMTATRMLTHIGRDWERIPADQPNHFQKGFSTFQKASPSLAKRVSKRRNWHRAAFYSAVNACDKQAMSRPKPGHPLNYGRAEI